MTWEWVAVLGIVVVAWTVLRVTAVWKEVTFYINAPEYVKRSIARATGIDPDDGN